MNDEPTRVLPNQSPKPERLDEKQRQQLTRVAILVIVALLVVTFIFRNTRDVPVSFIFFTKRASLIWVIFSSLVLGFIAGWLLPGQIRRYRERRRTM
ncbi:MAG TPA: LapA family protein [Miltoncostaeales bacterium]|jgi:uncharacterized integral membrane protein|nr:LapA family protein [Miltoncostaeales bacterium]